MNDVVIDQRMLEQFRMLERAGKPGILAQMVAMFVRGSAEQIAAIQAASAAGDAEKLRVTAHTLKSNAASFGATALAECCRVIEHDARAGVGTLWPERLAALLDLHRSSCAALNREAG
jgi:HPt (histidine-containing phosphotransfer) domain-containing protein